MLSLQQTPGEWRTVFYISAVIYFIGGIFYCIFAQGHVQDWAKPYMSDEEGPEHKAIYNKKDEDVRV